MSLLQRRANIVVALFSFLLVWKLRVRSLEPLDRIVVVVFSEESEAGLIERLRAVRTLGEPVHYVQEVGARFRPMTVEQVDSRAPQRVEFARLRPGCLIEPVQPDRRRQCVIVARRADKLIEDRPRGFCLSSLRVSFAEPGHRASPLYTCRGCHGFQQRDRCAVVSTLEVTVDQTFSSTRRKRGGWIANQQARDVLPFEREVPGVLGKQRKMPQRILSEYRAAV